MDSTSHPLSHLRLAAADLDGDRDDDLAMIIRGTGDKEALETLRVDRGQFSPAVRQWEGPAGTTELITGDFDGDDRTDIARLSKKALTVHYNNALDKPVVAWQGDLNPVTVSAANLDSDPADEIVALQNLGSKKAQLAVLDPSTWSTSTWWTGTFEINRTILSAADFTGTGRADVVIFTDTGDGTRGLDTFRSAGTTFANPTPNWSGRTGDTTTPLHINTSETYRILTNEGSCADIPSRQGASLTRTTCSPSSGNQSFMLRRLGATTHFHITVQPTGNCLEVIDWKHTDAAPLGQRTCDRGSPQTNQQFRLDDISGTGLGTTVTIRVIHSNKCLDATGPTIVQNACNPRTPGQRFRLTPQT